MKPTAIAFVIYGVTDLKKARDFYENTLGLIPASVWVNDAIGMIEYEMGEHTLAIGSGVPEFKPGLGGATVALEVTDFDATIKVLKEKGVLFILEPMETPVCHMATIQDPDGNKLMVHKRKEK